MCECIHIFFLSKSGLDSATHRNQKHHFSLKRIRPKDRSVHRMDVAICWLAFLPLAHILQTTTLGRHKRDHKFDGTLKMEIVLYQIPFDDDGDDDICFTNKFTSPMQAIKRRKQKLTLKIVRFFGMNSTHTTQYLCASNDFVGRRSHCLFFINTNVDLTSFSGSLVEYTNTKSTRIVTSTSGDTFDGWRWRCVLMTMKSIYRSYCWAKGKIRSSSSGKWWLSRNKIVVFCCLMPSFTSGTPLFRILLLPVCCADWTYVHV